MIGDNAQAQAYVSVTDKDRARVMSALVARSSDASPKSKFGGWNIKGSARKSRKGTEKAKNAISFMVTDDLNERMSAFLEKSGNYSRSKMLVEAVEKFLSEAK